MDKRETARALIAIQGSLYAMRAMFNVSPEGERAQKVLVRAARCIEEEAHKLEDEAYRNEVL